MASDSNSGGSSSTDTDDLTMQHELDIIELHAAATSTPMTKGTVISDTFTDADGYLNSLSSATATFDTDKYKHGAMFTDTFTRANNPVVGNGWSETDPSGRLSIASNKFQFVVADGTGSMTHALTSSPTRVDYILQSNNIGATQHSNVRLMNAATEVLMLKFQGDDIVDSNSNILDSGTITANVDFTVSMRNIDYTAHTFDAYLNGVSIGTALPFTNNEAGADTIKFDDVDCTVGGITQVWDSVEVFGAGDIEVICDLPAISGEVEATELILNTPDRETGDAITYTLIDTDTTEQTGLAIDQQNTIASVDGTKLGTGQIKIILTPKGTAPTAGYPSVRTYALKLWKV